jgi:putative RecB family exonuclease
MPDEVISVVADKMKRYTPAQIATFEICPKRYQFKYIDRLRKPIDNAEVFMDERVHETLAKLYRDLLLSKDNGIDELLNFFGKEWREKWHTGIKILKKEYAEENYFLTGERCITDYYKRYSPFDRSKTIGLGIKVEIPLNATGRSIVGIIDRLDYQGKGSFTVHNYKVSPDFPAHAKAALEKQLSLFQLAIHEMWNDVNEVHLVWHFLALDKKLRITGPVDTLETIKQTVSDRIATIENTSDFLPIESPLCQLCNYKPICPLWKHLQKIESQSIKKDSNEDGVSLVNRYIKLMEEKKRITDELQGIKEIIAEYTDNEGLENIFGTDYKLSVRREIRFTFSSPSQNSEIMQELEKWLKKNKKWSEVSKLDFERLENVLREKVWKEKLLAKLKDYAIVEKRAYFSTSKLEEEEH